MKNEYSIKQNRLLISVSEAIALTGVGRTTAYKLAKSGWPVVRVGRTIKIPLDQLKQWIETNCEGGLL